MNNFHVGQKVVCTDDSPTNELGFRELKAGKVYTIREVWSDPDGAVVRLHEVERLVVFGGLKILDKQDTPFWAQRFRPVVTRKTDISQFQRMLTDTKTQVPA